MFPGKRFCTGCGQPLSENTRFCVSCGALVAETPPPQNQPPAPAYQPAPVIQPPPPAPVVQPPPSTYQPAPNYRQPEPLPDEGQLLYQRMPVELRAELDAMPPGKRVLVLDALNKYQHVMEAEVFSLARRLIQASH
jgi:hypothetical protein